MTSVALKALWGRKLRTVLTMVAIVLGVATVSGTYVLTDSISGAFSSIFQGIYRGTDAAITGKSAIGETGGEADVPAFDESLLDEVQDIDGVAAAIGGVGGLAQIIGKDGKVITFGGAPNLGFSVDPSQPEFNTLTLQEGDWPGAGEVVIDESTASKKDIEVGDEVKIQAEGDAQPFTVSGLVKFGAAASLGGATLSGFDLPTAQQLFDKVGKLDQIRVAGRTGVASEELIARIKEILPPQTQVQSGDAQAASDSEETTEFLDFLQNFLLAFGGIALFVGAFVISNALSITIAQRTREFATLRTIGASRNQVLRSVLLEATVIGVIASVIGLFAGLALAKVLFAIFEAVGFTLPNQGLTLHGRTVIVALIVGIVVTVLASLRPAFRATRVPPIAAVREGSELPPGRFHRFRPIGSGGLAVLGFLLLALGLFGDGQSTTQILTLMGVGAVLIFLGVAMFSSHLVVPLSRVLGAPGARFGGAPGVLAQENAQRNPQRTGSTAAALMIGLALVTMVAMLASGIRGTFFNAVDSLWRTDYAVTAQNNFSPFPIAVEEPLRAVPGVTNVVGVRAGQGRALGETRNITAVAPGAAAVFQLDWVSGSQKVLDELGADGTVVSDGFAEDHALTEGSRISLLTPRGETQELVVKGIFDPPAGGSPFGSLTISAETFDGLYEQPKNLFVFLTTEGGEGEAATAQLEETLASFPNAKLQNQREFKDNQASGLSSILAILYVLLALSVIVSLFGIVNTLVLTVYERTREIGMLRAIGMTRWQVRRMIGFESVITAAIGGVVGIILGVVLAVLLIARVDLIDVYWPIASLIIFGIVSILAGIAAAIFPARRAAKLNVLEALHYE
jgi:putative ABC transport system permease protein